MGLERKHLIAGAFIAFVSWALLTDWIPSLRWIPYAFTAGVLGTLAGLLLIVFSTSKGTHYGTGTSRLGGLAVGRVEGGLGWIDGTAWEEAKAALKSRTEYRRPIILPEAVGFSKAVDRLLDLILRDFVTSWYRNISLRPTFQNEIDRCIRSVLLTIAARLTGVDLVELGISRVLPLVSAHLKEFYDAERAVRGKDLDHSVTESDELDSAVAAKYRSGRLHSAIGVQAATVIGQQSHMRYIMKGLLPIVLPANMKSSPAVTVLVQELVSCAVLTPVLVMLEDPDTWNQLIVYFGGPMLQDRKTVRKLRAALDQHAPASPKATRNTQFPRLRPYDTEKQFERFVRAVRHVSTLTDARRFRSEIIGQLRRDDASEGQDVSYMRRLETGKRLLDERITSLLSTDSAAKPKLQLPTMNGGGDALSRKQNANLRDLLYDASGLSYFMEYLDRSTLMHLVQFWLVVDGFRNPLEGDNDDRPGVVASESDRTDVAQIYESYLMRPDLQATDASLRAVRIFLKQGPKVDGQQYMAARHAVLQTQTQVYERMKSDQFEGFKRSDLYYKWLAIDGAVANSALPAASNLSPLGPPSPSERDRSPAKMRRPQLAVNREPELRRAVLSSTDLRTATRSDSSSSGLRRSLDDAGGRSALFGDDVDDERMMQSTSSLMSQESDGDAAQRAHDEATAVSAMQAALDNIVVDRDDKGSLFSDHSRQALDTAEQTPVAQPARPPLSTQASGVDKPSIASLGLVGAPSSRGVFIDDLFAEEKEKFAEDEREDSDALDKEDDDHVQEAAPGDLGLTEAIDALNQEIERLTAQKNIVISLTAKAELTNNGAELRILRKSEQSLDREIKRTEMQKQQYVVQESDNSLYGRAAVTIKSVMVGREDDGHEYALYVIEVRRQAGDNTPAATWAITRRYSQFHELHKRLRARFPAVRDLDFPRRQALLTLQKDFLQRRRVTLERYLRSLLLVPAITRSREFRAFLSQSAITNNGTNGSQADARDFVSRIYNSVSDGMEEFIGNIPVLDQLSAAGQNLVSAATAQMTGASIDALDPATHDPATAAEAEAELNAYETKELEPFVKPICDLFLEVFELSKGTSWLRGRTVVVVLHQLLGGTIERKVRDGVKTAFEDASLVSYVDLLKNSMWPDGQLRAAGTPRTAAEKARTRKEAALVLGALVPDMAGSVVGKQNAQAAARKLSAVVNNRRLNAHLILTLVDAVLRIVFPELADTQSK
ncbi:hypothetical protein B0A48_02955 [Cryoendolithus antarcticus]|uniref:PXA domain-containing protein n=1 Tax=Cryoendolithus antarcticus TaxID=1507870 RepID=A0A1V8TLP3_9PEZI|nr:hypothetical protein B0A48_02955 [Cryoendolithus antarcticus]